MVVHWTLALVHDVGRSSRQVSDALNAVSDAASQATAPIRARLGRRRRDGTVRGVRGVVEQPEVLSLEALEWHQHAASANDIAGALGAPIDLHADELMALANASGLTRALAAARSVLLSRGHHRAFENLNRCLAGATTAQRQATLNRFMARMERDPLVRQLVNAGPNANLTVEDADRVIGLARASATTALLELGLQSSEVAELVAALTEAQKPLADLVQLYTNPDGLLQILQRAWRVQRVGFTALRIAARRARGRANPPAVAPRLIRRGDRTAT